MQTQDKTNEFENMNEIKSNLWDTLKNCLLQYVHYLFKTRILLLMKILLECVELIYYIYVMTEI